MPTLLVLRHAKAASVLGVADADRPLTDRGRRDAAAAGAELRTAAAPPDRVLCSTALRTRQTFDALALEVPVEFDRGVYDNDVDTLLRLLRVLDDDGPVLLIGHNPSLHQLVHDLTGRAPESFPTSALATIAITGPWSEIGPGSGDLVDFQVPRG